MDPVSLLRRWLSERLSLAARITVLTSVAVGLTVAVVALALYLQLRHELISSMDQSLQRRAYAAVSTGDVTPELIQKLPQGAAEAADVRIALIQGDLSYTRDRQASDYIDRPEWEVANGTSRESIRTADVGGTRYRVIAVSTGPGGAVVLAQSLEPTERTLDRLAVVLWVIGIAGVVVAGMLGWAVANSGLRPVRRLTAAAERVARTEQLRPIEVTGDDELARLTTAFNSMLVSLDASRTRQQQLVADAGHELRTPLTSLRTNIELLTQADRKGGLDPRARSELLDDVQGQLLELSALVDDLVQLAREDPLRTEPVPLDLSEVVRTSIERVRRRAPGVRFEEDLEPWMVHGEAPLLERAVTNLLDNAAKWSPPGGTVSVALHDGRLSVADAGPGIAEEDRPHVFERFYRSREARTLPGSGLGLAIVAQTAHRHGGVVTASSSAAGGALFTMRLPGHAVART